MMKGIKFRTVSEYLAAQPPSTRKKLQELRRVIKKSAPNANEVISYNMPAYRQHGVLVYFAGYKSHIGFYPTSSAIAQFKDRLKGYAGAKGTVRFTLNEPIPLDLVGDIVKFRVADDNTRYKRQILPKGRAKFS